MPRKKKVRLEIPYVRIRFKRLRHLGKEAEVCGRDISIDPTGREPARYLLHELIHVRHPEWSETRVRREEAREWRALTWRQKAMLYQRLGRARIDYGGGE